MADTARTGGRLAELAKRLAAEASQTDAARREPTFIDSRPEQGQAALAPSASSTPREEPAPHAVVPAQERGVAIEQAAPAGTVQTTTAPAQLQEHPRLGNELLSGLSAAARVLRQPRAAIGLAGAAVALALFAVPHVDDDVIPARAQTQTVALAIKEHLTPPAVNLLETRNERNDPEARIVRILMQVSAGDLDGAMTAVDTLLADTPNFRLAHLVKGDLLMARAHPLSSFGAIADARQRKPRSPKGEFLLARADAAMTLESLPSVTSPAVHDLEEEARARLRRYTDELEQARQMPRYLMQLAPHQAHAVVVDTKRSRLLLYANAEGTPKLIRDYYITIGKNGPIKNREGDQRTPVGVYEITDDLAPGRLTDFYGSGAFPINYPNAWDQRAKRSGSGIWLHGVPSDTYSRPPRASNGCVVLANSDLDALRPYLRPGVTPVVIAEDLEWANPEDLAQARAELQSAVEQWRRDWESRDLESYARHYHQTFRGEGRSLDGWLAQRRSSNASKSWVTVRLDNVSILGYPGNEQLAVVSFEQDYRSNNFEIAARKRQYWLREEGLWRIVYEGLDS